MVVVCSFRNANWLISTMYRKVMVPSFQLTEQDHSNYFSTKQTEVERVVAKNLPSQGWSLAGEDYPRPTNWPPSMSSSLSWQKPYRRWVVRAALYWLKAVGNYGRRSWRPPPVVVARVGCLVYLVWAIIIQEVDAAEKPWKIAGLVASRVPSSQE